MSDGTMPVYQKDIQGNAMTEKKRRYDKGVFVRMSPEVLEALQSLATIHKNRFTQSDLIRDAILEKASRDAKKAKSGT